MEKKSVNEVVGKLVKDKRVAIGYNQEQLATAINLKRPSVCNIEQGRQSISIETLLKICAVLKCQPTDLLPKVPSVSLTAKSKIVKAPVVRKTFNSTFKW